MLKILKSCIHTLLGISLVALGLALPVSFALYIFDFASIKNILISDLATLLVCIGSFFSLKIIQELQIMNTMDNEEYREYAAAKKEKPKQDVQP